MGRGNGAKGAFMKPGVVAWLAAAVLAGCASYGVNRLVPGTSTVRDIEQTMGPPALKLSGGDGAVVWYYPSGPAGWNTYAVAVGPDGIVRGVEQRLTEENFGKIVPRKTAKKEVLELVGPALRVTGQPPATREVWEYQYDDVGSQWQLWVQFSDDGIVSEVAKFPHPDGNSSWNLQ